MTNIDHEFWAREILKYLVAHVKNFQGGRKFVYYGELAKTINYPLPYSGNSFARNIGNTLGEMGHLIENIIIDGEKPPYIQALVVATTSNLPGDGIKEFYRDYPDLSIDKKKDLISAVYQKIDDFGTRWDKLLIQLGINTGIDIKIVPKLNNRYGSEGSPEHRALRDFIFDHPEILSCHPSNKFREYPLKSGDIVDVVFEMPDEIIGIEVKSIKSGDDDLERGLFQCIKYRAVIEAEKLLQGTTQNVKCILVVEGTLPHKLIQIAQKLSVEYLDNFKHNNG